MEEQEILTTLEEILKSPVNLGESLIESSKEVTLETEFRADLGLDSLDTYEFLYAIEKRLNISIPEGKASGFEKVKDYVNYIMDYQKKHS